MKLNKAIKERWSPRAFSDKFVIEEQMALLFEAARWAPSARNEQPWQYFYALKTSKESFQKLVDCLTPGNQIWAQYAAALIVSVYKKNYDYKNRPNRTAMHDVGAANMSLAIQASELGFQVHQMGGFDRDKTIETLNLNSENLEPVTFIAVGYVGDPNLLPSDLKEREPSERSRKPISEFVTRL